MKKVLSIILTIALALSIVAPCAMLAEESGSCSEWAEEYVKRATALNWNTLTKAYSENITRGEFCLVTERMLHSSGLEVNFYSMETPFTDIGEGYSSETGAIKYLYCLGIVEGKSKTLFCPEDLSTREEAAVIFTKMIDAFRKWGVAFINPIGEEDFTYSDHDSIALWAQDAVYEMTNCGIIKGMGKSFNPKGNLTHEQAFAMLLRLYDLVEKSKAVTFADKMNTLMPRDKNYMFSPLSIKMALSLAANGAEGETKQEILDLLNIENVEEFNNSAKELIEKYSLSDKIRFDVANSIWINKSNTSQSFSNAYKSIAEEYYKAEAGEVTNLNAVEKVNGWIKEKTNGKIQGAIQDSNFWAMIVNAIYFKGMWQDKFSKSATKPDIFTSADGKETEIDFMNRTDWVYYCATGDSEIITMPYQTSFYYVDENGERKMERNENNLSASMYIILPYGEIDVEKELSKAYGNYEHTYMNLSIPKFEVEYSSSVAGMLKELGMNKAFAADAEFTKMFDEGSMFLTDVIHKTYIKVDEEGTEAAAITALPMAGSALPPQPIDFKVDTPFYFVVKVSDEIIFMGRYAYAK